MQNEETTETPDEKIARIAREAAMLEVGRADIAAGRFLTGEAAERWLDKWENGEEVAVPEGSRA